MAEIGFDGSGIDARRCQLRQLGRLPERHTLSFYSISSVIILGSPVTILGFIDRFTSIDLCISTA